MAFRRFPCSGIFKGGCGNRFCYKFVISCLPACTSVTNYASILRHVITLGGTDSVANSVDDDAEKLFTYRLHRHL